MSDQWKNRIVIVTTSILLFSFHRLSSEAVRCGFPQRKAPAHTVSFARYRQLALRKLYGI